MLQTFHDFMEASLYGLPAGFYQTREAGADFYTAPELHPAFGRLLGAEVASLLRRLEEGGEPGPYRVVEAGCGEGTLFPPVLQGLREALPDLAPSLRWALADRSPGALARALDRARETGIEAEGVPVVSSLEPSPGVIYSNELLDALPFHLLEKREDRMVEVLFDLSGRPAWGEVPDGPLRRAAARVGPFLAEGGRHVVCPGRGAWLREAAAGLTRGFILSVDYGRRYPGDVPVPVKTFRAHRLGEDPFESPGRTDLTAPVDFEEVISEGEAAGLALEWYGTLGTFLLDRGILGKVQDVGEGLKGFQERARLKTLFHPEGMGEAFKVLIQSKGMGDNECSRAF